ncbi:MAG: decarboxylating 6-phosphogluconate dehydrogenase [Actinomycetia bacterium]|nr:decarboxylating 6-phosphogluconate dehydrogenase [Actinomycetes bacterium]
MRLGMIGLGRMGGSMAERLRSGGHEVIGHDPGVESDANSLPELVDALRVDDSPVVVWSMVPSGAVTQAVIDELTPLLVEGDVVVDGGNADFTDSVQRASDIAAAGIGFVDAGVSGGVWGLENGYALMVGGTDDAVAKVAPALETLAPSQGFRHIGPAGAGHFTKMVHNGIEYGMMQSIAEGYELLAASELDIDIPGALESWQEGSVVRSWLLDLLVRAEHEDPALVSIAGLASDSGEGRWTIREAVRLGVPVPAISAAIFARFTSQQADSVAMKVVAALRDQFGGHGTVPHE